MTRGVEGVAQGKSRKFQWCAESRYRSLATHKRSHGASTSDTPAVSLRPVIATTGMRLNNRMMRTGTWKTPYWFSLRLLLVAACVLQLACGTFSSVEGIVQEEGFVVRDASPGARWVGERLVVMVSEEDGQTLRVVTLSLPEADSLPTDTPIAISEEKSGQPFVDVAWGDLDVQVRSDGARILSTIDTKFQHGTEGILTLQREDGNLHGNFEVTLRDGGYLEGAFWLEQVPAR